MDPRIYRDTTVNTNPANPPTSLSIFKISGPVDLPLIMVMVAFIVFGLIMVFSASWDFSLREYDGNALYQFIHQIIWIALGILIIVFLSMVDYHNWRRFALPAMLVTIAALLLVLVVNETRLGAVRAILQGSVQPSELAKVITVIYLAVWLHSKREQLHDIQWGLIPLAIIIGVICGLIIRQPDYSAAITVFMLGGLLFFLGGGDMKQIITLLLFAFLFGALVAMSPTVQSRVNSYISGIQDPTKASDHVRYSLEAIVNGGWFGVGIGHATIKLVVLPFASTDSIFAVIAEELGFVGAAGTVLLYILLIWRGMLIADRAPDMLGSLLAVGLTLWIGVEALINILVMVSLLPFAGNALPFISYGGSNMVCSCMAIGILMNISRQKVHQAEKEEWSNFGASIDLRGRNRRRSLSRLSRS